jgi:hypothetical protein
MKVSFLVGFLALALSCGTTNTSSPEVITPIETAPEIVEIPAEVIIEEPAIPEGGVLANFVKDAVPFYASVANDKGQEKGTTTIHFDDNFVPAITIPEAHGAKLSSVRFPGFESDLLLAETIYKDPIFRKYYLYVCKDKQWKPVVDGFILHVDNVQEGFVPLEVDPNNSNQMVRKYSVFDLDTQGATTFRWILNEETTPILNR